MTDVRELKALLVEGRESFESFCRRHGVRRAVFNSGTTTPKLQGAWVEFMIHEAQPRNRKVLALFKEIYPDSAQVKMLGHYVQAYDELIANWNRGVFEELNCGVNWPLGLDELVSVANGESNATFHP